MAKVCFSCGLTVDSQGRLIVNTGGAEWPLGCAETNGQAIYCGADGVVRTAPEKFHTREQRFSPSATGQVTSATFGSPTIGGGTEDWGTPLTYVLANPSECLPMRVAVRYGIHHAIWAKIGAGNSQTLYGLRLAVTGSIVDTNEVHQQWRHDGSVNQVSMDTPGQETLMFTLPAGGTATFTATPIINVASYNGNTTLTNLILVLDVDAWN